MSREHEDTVGGTRAQGSWERTPWGARSPGCCWDFAGPVREKAEQGGMLGGASRQALPSPRADLAAAA